jgi:integrase
MRSISRGDLLAGYRVLNSASRLFAAPHTAIADRTLTPGERERVRATVASLEPVAGCKTLDLCKAKSADLDGNSLTLSASVTKTRTARTVPLPADLANRLHKVKGPIYLRENSVEECRQFRSGTRNQIADEFDPSTWRWTIQNLFREFNEKRAKKDQVRPHDLRARAITLVAAATQSVDATAEALGVDPQTARHYLDAGKAFQGSELLKKFAQVLLPETPRESRV